MAGSGFEAFGGWVMTDALVPFRRRDARASKSPGLAAQEKRFAFLCIKHKIT
jgi:hypothetical protein